MSQEYTVTLTATNNAGSSSINLNVIILDVPDIIPRWNNKSEWIYINENEDNLLINKASTLLTSGDSDVLYSIGDTLAITQTETSLTIQSVNDVFTVDENTGDLYFTRSIDYETDPRKYIVQLIATNLAGSDTLQLNIDINDINDISPKWLRQQNGIFEEVQFEYIDIPSGADSFNFLSVLDPGDSDVYYSLLSSYEDIFYINELSGSINSNYPIVFKEIVKTLLNKDLNSGSRVLYVDSVEGFEEHQLISIRHQDPDYEPSSAEEVVQEEIPIERIYSQENVSTLMIDSVGAGSSLIIINSVDNIFEQDVLFLEGGGTRDDLLKVNSVIQQDYLKISLLYSCVAGTNIALTPSFDGVNLNDFFIAGDGSTQQLMEVAYLWNQGVTSFSSKLVDSLDEGEKIAIMEYIPDSIKQLDFIVLNPGQINQERFQVYQWHRLDITESAALTYFSRNKSSTSKGIMVDSLENIKVGNFILLQTVDGYRYIQVYALKEQAQLSLFIKKDILEDSKIISLSSIDFENQPLFNYGDIFMLGGAENQELCVVEDFFQNAQAEIIRYVNNNDDIIIVDSSEAFSAGANCYIESIEGFTIESVENQNFSSLSLAIEAKIGDGYIYVDFEGILQLNNNDYILIEVNEKKEVFAITSIRSRSNERLSQAIEPGSRFALIDYTNSNFGLDRLVVVDEGQDSEEIVNITDGFITNKSYASVNITVDSSPGDSRIYVDSLLGFNVGDTVFIGSGHTQEKKRIGNYGVVEALSEIYHSAISGSRYVLLNNVESFNAGDYVFLGELDNEEMLKVAARSTQSLAETVAVAYNISINLLPVESTSGFSEGKLILIGTGANQLVAQISGFVLNNNPNFTNSIKVSVGSWHITNRIIEVNLPMNLNYADWVIVGSGNKQQILLISGLDNNRGWIQFSRDIFGNTSNFLNNHSAGDPVVIRPFISLSANYAFSLNTGTAVAQGNILEFESQTTKNHFSGDKIKRYPQFGLWDDNNNQTTMEYSHAKNEKLARSSYLEFSQPFSKAHEAGSEVLQKTILNLGNYSGGSAILDSDIQKGEEVLRSSFLKFNSVVGQNFSIGSTVFIDGYISLISPLKNNHYSGEELFKGNFIEFENQVADICNQGSKVRKNNFLVFLSSSKNYHEAQSLFCREKIIAFKTNFINNINKLSMSRGNIASLEKLGGALNQYTMETSTIEGDQDLPVINDSIFEQDESLDTRAASILYDYDSGTNIYKGNFILISVPLEGSHSKENTEVVHEPNNEYELNIYATNESGSALLMLFIRIVEEVNLEANQLIENISELQEVEGGDLNQVNYSLEKLEQENNVPPLWSAFYEDIYVEENTVEVNRSATIIESGNSPIVYSIDNLAIRYFNLDIHTGEITFKQAPDYEADTSRIVLGFESQPSSFTGLMRDLGFEPGNLICCGYSSIIFFSRRCSVINSWAYQIISSYNCHVLGKMNGSSVLGVLNGSNRFNVHAMLLCDGDIVAYQRSDAKLKKNIKCIDRASLILNKIKPMNFVWNKKQKVYEGDDFGFIAQDLEKVIPIAVKTRDDGIKAVSYTKIIPLLVSSIKERECKINMLLDKIKKLKN